MLGLPISCGRDLIPPFSISFHIFCCEATCDFRNEATWFMRSVVSFIRSSHSTKHAPSSSSSDSSDLCDGSFVRVERNENKDVTQQNIMQLWTYRGLVFEYRESGVHYTGSNRCALESDGGGSHLFGKEDILIVQNDISKNNFDPKQNSALF